MNNQKVQLGLELSKLSISSDICFLSFDYMRIFFKFEVIAFNAACGTSVVFLSRNALYAVMLFNCRDL